MDKRNNSDTIIIKDDSDLIKLSEYLEVLSSDVRLKILKLIEKEPKDIGTISNEIKTSYVNTRKHMDKLLKIGVIIAEGDDKKTTIPKGHRVWRYTLVPGGLEIILRNLGTFSNIRFEYSDKIEKIKERISEELIGKVPLIKVLGGADDGKSFLIKKDSIRIGRIDPENLERYDSINDVVLSRSYTAVTRVSKPHARLSSDGNAWYVEDCESKGGTYLNDNKLEKYKRIKLSDGDAIWLSKGAKESMGVCLLFSLKIIII